MVCEPLRPFQFRSRRLPNVSADVLAFDTLSRQEHEDLVASDLRWPLRLACALHRLARLLKRQHEPVTLGLGRDAALRLEWVLGCQSAGRQIIVECSGGSTVAL